LEHSGAYGNPKGGLVIKGKGNLHHLSREIGGRRKREGIEMRSGGGAGGGFVGPSPNANRGDRYHCAQGLRRGEKKKFAVRDWPVPFRCF